VRHIGRFAITGNRCGIFHNIDGHDVKPVMIHSTDS